MRVSGAIVAAMMLLAATPAAAVGRAAAGANVGTAGLGADLQFQVNEFLVLRGGASFLKFEFDETYDDVDYDAEIDFSNIAAFADLHPFANAFVVAAGVYYGEKTVNLDATPTAPVEIGDQLFAPGDVGVLSGAAELNDAAPFAGLGFSNAFSGGRVSVQALAGVMMTGEADVSLSSEGGALSGAPALEAELRREEERLEADLSDYEFYPVLTLGFNVRF